MWLQFTTTLLLPLPLLLLPLTTAIAGCTAKGLNATGKGIDGTDYFTLYGCIKFYDADKSTTRSVKMHIENQSIDGFVFSLISFSAARCKTPKIEMFASTNNTPLFWDWLHLKHTPGLV